MGGFTKWAERIAEAKSGVEYRQRVSDPESVSMWQSLSFGANYKRPTAWQSAPLERM